MVSKSEELAALNKIRKIVEGLGPDSYLEATFKGCFDLGESNIKNDFFESYYGKVEILRESERKLTQELRETQELCSKYSEELAEMVAEKKTLEKSFDFVLDMLSSRNYELNERNAAIAHNFEYGVYNSIEEVAKAYEEIRKNRAEMETIVGSMRDIAKSE